MADASAWRRDRSRQGSGRWRRLASCASLGLALLAAGCERAALHAADEGEALRVAALLESHQIPVRIEDSERDGDWLVLVPEQELPTARALLVAHHLPAPLPAPPDDAGLLGPDRDARHRRHEQQRARDLERTLEMIHGVLDARVHLSLPAPAPWPTTAAARDAAPATASVLVLHQDDVAAPDVPALQAMIAAAVSELSPDRVVVAVESRALTPGPRAALVQLGPWLVARGSASSLRWALGALLTLLILLAALSVALIVRRRRRLDPAPDP